MVRQIDQMNDRRIGLELFEEVREPNTFLWIEQLDNHESLSNYYLNNKFRAMMGAIAVLATYS